MRHFTDRVHQTSRLPGDARYRRSSTEVGESFSDNRAERRSVASESLAATEKFWGRETQRQFYGLEQSRSFILTRCAGTEPVSFLYQQGS